MNRENAAVLILVLSFLYLTGITFLEITPVGIEFAKLTVGFVLGTCFSTLINYYWGGASTNETKTKEDVNGNNELSR